MDGPSLIASYDGDTEMLPIDAVVDQVAGSLRQLREQFEYRNDGDIHMESAFEHQSNSYQSPQPLRLLIIDTNILIGHLNLIEWLGELLLATRKLCRKSDYRCGLLIPTMVRLELDKHKMPHNKQRMVTALLEPPPAARCKQISIHSPEGSKLAGSSSNVSQSIRVSLYEAADQAFKWMTRLFRSTPSDCSIVKFQTKTEVVDPALMSRSSRTAIKVSPDMHILDCASYFKLQVEPQGGGVILFTNDKALSLEAELAGISTLRIRPSLSPQSLLYSFDPALAQQIDLLISQVSFKDMLTANWYRKSGNVNSKLIPLTNSTDDPSTRGHHPRYVGESKCSHNKEKTFSNESPNLTERTHNILDNAHESSTAMPIDIDEDMPISDSELIPIFPPLFYQYILTPSFLPIPKHLHLHHHIEQAVAALLRPRLFDFLFHALAHNDLALLFQRVAFVFDRRKIDPEMSNAQDPNRWTAVDCLTLIDEFWNESTFELFREGTEQSFSESTHRTINKAKLETKTSLRSRWGPSSQFMTELDEQQIFPYSSPLGRLRKVVLVLIKQLQPYNRTNLPRDSPMSWPFLLWDGLIENIREVAYYGRFYETLSDLEDVAHSKDHILQKVIQNWRTEARSLCCESP